jgi:hypothetical protein
LCKVYDCLNLDRANERNCLKGSYTPLANLLVQVLSLTQLEFDFWTLLLHNLT